MERDRLMRGRPVVAGEASGVALVSREPLSFWGGYDSRTGAITERRHPLSGQIAAGRILALPFTRGSSTTTAVFVESVRSGTAPKAVITAGVDCFVSLASIVADELYGKTIPVIAVETDDYRRLETGQRVEIKADGTLAVSSP
jgi:predicted aconitase with swiveling domain